MHLSRGPFLLLLCCFMAALAAQPRDLGFGPPMHLPMHLSGTFGEPRGSHFHSGIDIRTNERIGYPVLAVADGTLSRIRVSPVGYGKAMYINHPNGFTTVYAHLDRFAPALEKYVRKEQYRVQNYTVDMSVASGTFRFKKGDTIAWSGNTGSSGGPHLHFEIRETKSEWPVNPFLYGYKKKDTQPPLLQGLYWYDLSNYYALKPQAVGVRRATGSRWTADTLYMPSNTRFGLGWKGYDQQEGVPNRNGLYSLKMTVNEKTLFAWEMQRFSFDETRYASGHVDFRMKQTGQGDIYHCFRLPGNRASVLDRSPANGTLHVKEGDTLNIAVTAADVNGNETLVRLVVVGVAPVFREAPVFNVWPQKSFQYSAETATVHIPGGAFYDSLFLKVNTRNSNDNSICSDILSLHDDYVPLHREATIQLRANSRLPKGLEDKAIIVHRDLKGKESALGTKREGGFYVASTRSTGDYYLRVDTIPPDINLRGKEVHPTRGAQFTIRDQLSGIASYNVYLNGKWTLAAYDAKADLLTWEPEEKLSPGKHLLKVDVRDAAGNLRSLTLSIQP